MAHSAAPSGHPRRPPVTLRGDLIELRSAGQRRAVKLVDAIAGRVARLSRRDLLVLKQLGKVQPASDAERDSQNELAAQALQLGLLRARPPSRSRDWTRRITAGPLAWLCIRIPLISIDRTAARLARASDWLFHPLAVFCWLTAVLTAAASLLVGWERAVASAGRLQLWGQSSSGAWLAIAATFVLTKVAHELAHAIACRRAGVPCGEIGLFLFAGMPCPYCDVSHASRVDHTAGRVGVMAAGIYIELILATLATALWWVCQGGPLQSLAINVIIVCGISTVLFNANPLMRLDGYYVLADLLGVANLRATAATAWHGLVTARLGGWSTGRVGISRRTLALAAYHLASTIYRISILLAILWLVIRVSASWSLGSLGMGLAAITLVPVVAAPLGGLLRIAAGQGPWRRTRLPRRAIMLGGSLLLASTAALLPLPRYAMVDGVVDYTDALPVHAGQDGWVVEVTRDFGDRVQPGETLFQLDWPPLQLQRAVWKSRQQMAALQSAMLRRQALRDESSDVAWDLDAANAELVNRQWQALQSRIDRLSITAPCEAVVLPPSAHLQDAAAVPSGGDAADLVPVDGPHSDHRTGASLAEWVGRYVDARHCFCRLGDPQRRAALLLVDADHRQLIRSGQTVRLVADIGAVDGRPWAATSQVGAISEIRVSDAGLQQPPARQRATASWPASQFRIRCDLPAADPPPAGTAVQAKIHLGDEPLWRRFTRQLAQSLRQA